jgi:hypothetical protein
MTQRRLLFRDGDFIWRCDYCREYWPLTTEFWQPKSGLNRCRGCWSEYFRIKQAGYAAEARTVTRFKNAMYYQANRERITGYNRAWKAAHRDQVRAYNLAYRARKKAA